MLKPNIGERYVFKRIKYDAKRYGREFNISLEWFVNTCHLPCHYCNRTDIKKATVHSKSGTPLLKDFRYNGLDRVDNAVGYEESNCVPCCVVCNRAKNSMPYDEFIEYIRGLVNYQSSLGDQYANQDDTSVHAARIPDRSGYGQAGNDSHIEESPEDSLPVFAIRYDGFYMDSRGIVEFTRGFHGGPYREIKGAV